MIAGLTYWVRIRQDEAKITLISGVGWSCVVAKSDSEIEHGRRRLFGDQWGLKCPITLVDTKAKI